MNKKNSQDYQKKKKKFTAKISRITHNKMSNQSAVNHAIRQKRIFPHNYLYCAFQN